MKVFIGNFTAQDLKNGNDKIAIDNAINQEHNKRNGIKYIVSQYDKKKQLMKIWLTDNY